LTKDSKYRFYEELIKWRKESIKQVQEDAKQTFLNSEHLNNKIRKLEDEINAANIAIRVKQLAEEKKRMNRKNVSTQTMNRAIKKKMSPSQRRLYGAASIVSTLHNKNKQSIKKVKQDASNNSAKNVKQDTEAENDDSYTRKQSEDGTPRTYSHFSTHRQTPSVHDEGNEGDDVWLQTDARNTCTNAINDNTEAGMLAELEPKALNFMMTSFNNLLMKQVKQLQDRIQQAQKETEHGTHWLLEKELKLSTLVAKLTPTVKTLQQHLNSLPTLELSDTEFVINNRPSVNHTCNSCMCKSFPCMLEVDSKEVAHQAGRTLDYAHSYVQALDQLRA
jgi:hypothetical protein